MLRSYSHLLAGLPCYRYPFCFVVFAGFQFETELGLTAVVVFGNHPCLPPVIWLCLRIHDVIPLAADKSSALCVALVVLSTHGSSTSTERGCCLRRGCFLSCSLRSWLLGSVVSWVAGFDDGGDVDVRGTHSCVTFTCLSLRLYATFLMRRGVMESLWRRRV